MPEEKNKAIIPTKEQSSARKKLAAPTPTGTEARKRVTSFATAKKKKRP